MTKSSTAKSKPAKTAKQPKATKNNPKIRPAKAAAPARRKGSRSVIGISKLEQCLTLLRRGEGATIGELMSATGWQSHSVRGFLSGTVKRKLGLALTSSIGPDSIRRYRVSKDEV